MAFLCRIFSTSYYVGGDANIIYLYSLWHIYIQGVRSKLDIFIDEKCKQTHFILLIAVQLHCNLLFL